MSRAKLDHCRARRDQATQAYDAAFTDGLAQIGDTLAPYLDHAQGAERGLIGRAIEALDAARRMRAGEPVALAALPQAVAS